MLQTFFLEVFTLVCVPWLLFMSVQRKRYQNVPRRVLVVQTAKIGDLLCTTPLFRALHMHGDCVTVLCLGRTAEILQGNPCVADAVAFDAPQYCGLCGKVRLLSRLFFSHFDVSLVALPGGTNTLLGLWTAAPLRVTTRGRTVGCFERVSHFFHRNIIRYQRGTRTYEHYMALAAAAGADRVPYKHEIFLTDAERENGVMWLRDHGIQPGDPFVLFSLSAGNRLKEWPLERFIAVARHVRQRWRMKVAFSSADSAVTQRAFDALGSDGEIDAGGLDLRSLAAVIAHARLFVSVDTGPLYMAHALGIPIIDIVGPVDPREQPPPPGPLVTLVLPSTAQPTSFVADTLRVATEGQRRALDETTVEMVCKSVDEMLCR